MASVGGIGLGLRGRRGTARQLAMPMTSTAMRLNGELFSGSGPERLDWVFRAVINGIRRTRPPRNRA